MSDTLISQQLSLPMMPDNQLSQMNPAVSRADLSMPNVLEGSMEPLSTNPTIDHLPVSSMKHHPLDCHPTFSASMGQEIPASYNVNGKSECTSNNMSIQQFSMPSGEAEQPQLMKPYSVVPNAPLPNKRKATTELIPDNRGAEKMSAPNRRLAHINSFAKASGTSASLSNSVTSGASGKKVVQLESVKTKSQLIASKKNALPQVPSKTSTESNDSVRAKLRESLASALALVSQQQETSSDGKIKGEKEATATVEKGVPLVSVSSNSTANLGAGKPEESCVSSTSLPTDGVNDINCTSHRIHPKEKGEEANQTWNYIGDGFQPHAVISGEDVSFGDSFLFRDELLQGNGLTWAMDLSQVPEAKKIEHIEKPEMLREEVAGHENEQIIQSPESVAFKIEAELFKLFGGVNKKYKEKGRSLLFNLKDRNNPELRERVMSGDISPERLCSMTAEGLASKELSQWRIAKAEELAQMIVLPDSETNMRRLVKKTHKGEYTVDLDPSVDALEEIPSGTSASHQNRSRTKSVVAGAHRKVEQSKVDQDNQCEITIPSDGADMQGLMVDDVRDLPPIVSLDEFMESLDKEPPFENLPGGSSHESNKEPLPSGKSHESKKEDLEPGSKSLSSVQASKDHVEATLHKTDDVMDSIKQNGSINSTDTQKGSDINTPAHLPKGGHVWEGLLQISISSMANFVAFYISGEKSSTKEWPSFFDIKGRVKLDAFDKFVQALPMSRSRAIMVTHFMLKEGSSEADRAGLVEVIDSYIMDQRLGFAEPAPGVELYLCPPCSKSVDVIVNHLSKGYTEKLKDIDNGLIGLLVWRKVQITPTISPDSSLHHKDMTKKNPFSTSGGHQNAETDMTNRNYGFAYRNDHLSPPPPPPPPLSTPQPPVDDDDDDDVPPGFGPPGWTRDDDDLPEFNFPGSSNPPTSRVPNPNPFPGRGGGVRHPHHPQAPPGQVEQMRELIQKYGKNGNNASSGSGIPTQPWNDDDDDIPEWQPQAQAVAPPPFPIHNPGLPVHHQVPAQPPPWAPAMQPLQPPMRVPQQGTWWPYGPPTPNSVGNQAGGQLLGTPGGHPGSRERGRHNNRGF